MPVLKRLQPYLDSHKIPYEVISHDAAYSARRTGRGQGTTPGGIRGRVCPLLVRRPHRRARWVKHR
jgi:hypothetical protein